MRITDLAIQRLSLPDGATKQKTFYDDTLKGFGIRVSVGGAKTFVVMYSKRRKRMTLGRYPDISLAEARKKAKKLQGEVAGMSDVELTVHISPTFNEARIRFLEDAMARLKLSSYEQYSRPLTKHFEFSKRVGEITRQEVMKAVNAAKDSPSTTRHAFVAIRTMMSWCVLQGLINASPVPPLQFKVPSRSRILSDDELKTVWLRAERVGYPFGKLVQLLILTGQRRGEIAGLRKSWINDDTIIFPVGFCKNKREHRVPIGAMMRAILSSIVTDGDLLFPARGKPNSPINGWPKAKREFDAPLELAPYTLHDLRRTYSSNLAKLGVPIHVTEKLLNHVSGTISGVAAVYNRHSYWEEMKVATAQHDEFLQRLTTLANPTVA